MIAVHPTSCSTFNAANKRQPFCPKLIFVESIALKRIFPPITPARNNKIQPMTCPATIAKIPFFNPKGARYVPVSISAIETPAPNQINAFSNKEVFFIKHSPLHIHYQLRMNDPLVQILYQDQALHSMLRKYNPLHVLRMYPNHIPLQDWMR